MNDTRIAWDEDGARIEADVIQSAADVLELRLHLRSEVSRLSVNCAAANPNATTKTRRREEE